MNIAFCYESVVPGRGGCETYIADLARRLCADRHQVHLYASRWDESTLPKSIVYHALPRLGGPRFLRPWRFGRLCWKALQKNPHDVTMGFDKTWGQDILYPQGGLHLACAEHNLLKFRWQLTRDLARWVKKFDPAGWSFRRLERRQYLGAARPLVMVNSNMVRDHFRRYYDFPLEELFLVRSAIDPSRLVAPERVQLRQAFRERWGIPGQAVVGLFAGINYRLKGLDPLLYALKRMLESPDIRNNPDNFRLAIAGSRKNTAYQHLARRLGVDKHAIFLGHCGDMRSGYFASDFLVHPTFYDPCSLVVLEALACGLPVITSRFNGASELMHGDLGYVIDDPHDRNHLAWCMMQMLDADRRLAWGQAARSAAAHWTFEHHYRQFLGICAAAMARKEPAIIEVA